MLGGARLKHARTMLAERWLLIFNSHWKKVDYQFFNKKMFTFVKQKKIMDDLSTIKKKQLAKQSHVILEKRHEIQRMHELDGVDLGAPKNQTPKQRKKAERKSSTPNEKESPQIPVKPLSLEESTKLEDFNYDRRNHLFALSEQFNELDPELSLFYMKKFHNDMICSDEIQRHYDKYAKCCLFCGHSFLDRNTGYQLMKQPSNKIVIKDCTKGDKNCLLNLKKFFGSKDERTKWSHLCKCLCAPKHANNNIFSFRCKSCHKYLIVPFDKELATQVQKQKVTSTEPQEQISNQKKSLNEPKTVKIEPAPNTQPKSTPTKTSATTTTQPQNTEKKRKRNNNSNSKNKKNKGNAADDFLKLL